MNIEVKMLGRRQPFLRRSMALPGGRLTLSELIAALVRQELSAYNERQSEVGLLRVLTEDEMSVGKGAGKIAASPQERSGTVSEDKAIQTAITAFGDGLYHVFIDDKRAKELNEELHLHEESTLLLLRLTALVGG